MESKKWRLLNINSETLLGPNKELKERLVYLFGPNYSEKVSWTEDDAIKDSLFEFVLLTGEKL